MALSERPYATNVNEMQTRRLSRWQLRVRNGVADQSESTFDGKCLTQQDIVKTIAATFTGGVTVQRRRVDT